MSKTIKIKTTVVKIKTKQKVYRHWKRMTTPTQISQYHWIVSHTFQFNPNWILLIISTSKLQSKPHMMIHFGQQRLVSLKIQNFPQNWFFSKSPETIHKKKFINNNINLLTIKHKNSITSKFAAKFWKNKKLLFNINQNTSIKTMWIHRIWTSKLFKKSKGKTLQNPN